MFRPFLLSLAFLGLQLIAASPAQAVSPPFPEPPAGSVFASSELLKIELDAPLASLFANRVGADFSQYKKATVPGRLRYRDESGKAVEVGVTVSMKGFSSLMMCNFPKLELKIEAASAQTTIFSNMRSLDLNTHCDYKDAGMRSRAANYVHREEMLYQFAKVLEIPTYESRPLMVSYLNSGILGFDERVSQPAFFIEDMGALEKRLNAREIKSVSDYMKDAVVAKKPSKAADYKFDNVQDAIQADPEDTARIALFENLLGNGDWFISTKAKHFRHEDGEDRLWNIKVLEMADGKWVQFPQDFNLAFILSGDYYAGLNSDELPQYYGLISPAAFSRIEKNFLSKKSQLLRLTEKLSLDPEGQKLLQNVLNQFFVTLKAEDGQKPPAEN